VRGKKKEPLKSLFRISKNSLPWLKLEGVWEIRPNKRKNLTVSKISTEKENHMTGWKRPLSTGATPISAWEVREKT